MKQKSQVALRMEFLEVGDRLGFPKVGYGFGKRVKEGEAAWTAFASRARLSELAPAFRNARIRLDYLTEAMVGLAEPTVSGSEAHDRMAKARAAKAAKRAAAEVV